MEELFLSWVFYCTFLKFAGNSTCGRSLDEYFSETCWFSYILSFLLIEMEAVFPIAGFSTARSMGLTMLGFLLVEEEFAYAFRTCLGFLFGANLNFYTGGIGIKFAGFSTDSVHIYMLSFLLVKEAHKIKFENKL